MPQNFIEPGFERLEGVVGSNFSAGFFLYGDDDQTQTVDIDTSDYMFVFELDGLPDIDSTGDSVAVSQTADSNDLVTQFVTVFYSSTDTATLCEDTYRFRLKVVSLTDDTDVVFLQIGSVDFTEP